MFKLIKRYSGKYLKDLILSVVFVIFQVVSHMTLIMPETKRILDHGVVNHDIRFIMVSGFKMLIYSLINLLVTIIYSYYSAKATAGITYNIRSDCFEKVSKMNEQQFSQFGASTLLTRTMTDPIAIQNLIINSLRSLLMAPIVVVCMLVMIFKMNKTIFLILFPIFVITVVVLFVLSARSKAFFEILQQKLDKINLLMRECISGVRSIRAFCNQKLQEERLENANNEAYDAAISANSKINFLAPVSLIVMNWTVVIIFFVGTSQLQKGMASISDMILIFQYLAYFISSLAVIHMMINMLPKASVASRRILELLDFDITAYDGKNKFDNSYDKKGRVEFKNVIFGYTGAADIVTGISFAANAGKTTAFIGTTGSGKTTIMNLLTGLYSMNFGDILIDGVSIRSLDEKSLRRRISYGTQVSMVFQDTVYNNITAYNGDCTMEDVESACECACFTEVLDKMPDGLNTVMSKGGMNISGGQRQRLSIARTVAKDADIYVFDDTFSALDAKTDVAVRKNIAKRLEGKTVIIVAQKISTIMDADNIIVLDKGKIAGQGTHEELLNTCTEYRNIYNTQCYA